MMYNHPHELTGKPSQCDAERGSGIHCCGFSVNSFSVFRKNYPQKVFYVLSVILYRQLCYFSLYIATAAAKQHHAGYPVSIVEI